MSLTTDQRKYLAYLELKRRNPMEGYIMGLKKILEHIQEAEKGITQLLEQHSGEMMLYTFVYEQQYVDEEGWGPNYQSIYAHDIAEAFSSFGCVVRQHKLTVRNVCYGKQTEMLKEMDRVSEYYRARLRSKDER